MISALCLIIGAAIGNDRSRAWLWKQLKGLMEKKPKTPEQPK